MDILSKLQENKEKIGEKTFLFTEKENYTFREVWEKSCEISAFLKKRGLKRGDRVAIISENSPYFVFSLFGVMHAGGIPVPINYLLGEQMVEVIKDVLPAVILISPKFEEKQKLFSNFADVFFLPECKEKGISSPSPTEEAVIIYTSGSTGFPRGVILTHQNLIADIIGCLKRIEVYPEDRFSVVLPLFHSFSLTTTLLTPLFAGAGVVISPEIKFFEKAFEILLRHKTTIFISIPFIYKLLVDLPISSLPFRFCVSGGEKLLPSLEKEFETKFNIPILQGYGLTEASPVVSLNPLGREKEGSVGPPLEGIKIKIHKEKIKSRIGEIIIKGPTIMKGYWRKPEITKEVIREGWLYTGDMGYIDKEGYLFLVGRKKDMIIVKGLNVYPSEIERVLMEIPQIKECAVVGVKRKDKEIIVAFVKKAGQITETEIKRYLHKRVASYKIPRRIEFVEDFPYTSTGKIDKRKLGMSYGEG